MRGLPPSGWSMGAPARLGPKAYGDVGCSEADKALRDVVDPELGISIAG